MAVIGVNLTNTVATGAGQVDRIRRSHKKRRFQGVKCPGRFREKLLRDGQPCPNSRRLVGKELCDNDLKFPAPNPLFPQMAVENRGQFHFPGLTASNARRCRSQCPHFIRPGLLQVTFRKVRRIEVNHRRSSSNNLPESESMAFRRAKPGTSFRSRNGCPGGFSKGDSVATGCPRSVMLIGSLIPRTHLPVFMCNSRIETETMCSMCHIRSEMQACYPVYDNPPHFP